MGFTSVWSISAHDDSFTGALAPRLLPLIAAERDEPLARERRERWRREPLPDFRTWCPSAAPTAVMRMFRDEDGLAARILADPPLGLVLRPDHPLTGHCVLAGRI